MGKVCAFFEHREVWENLDAPLDDAIRKAVLEYGVTEFWNGGYGKFDSLSAAAVNRAKRDWPQLQLIRVYAYLPREKLSDLYDGSIYPEGLETGLQRFAISKRNIWIARNCDMVICYVRNEYGGAYEACRTAARAGKPILNLSGKELFHLP